MTSFSLRGWMSLTHNNWLRQVFICFPQFFSTLSTLLSIPQSLFPARHSDHIENEYGACSPDFLRNPSDGYLSTRCPLLRVFNRILFQDSRQQGCELKAVHIACMVYWLNTQAWDYLPEFANTGQQGAKNVT